MEWLHQAMYVTCAMDINGMATASHVCDLRYGHKYNDYTKPCM